MLKALSLLLTLATAAGPIDDLSAYDREAQAAAVAALAATCDGCEDELLALWDATDRFDVRAHIVQTFVAMGERGTAGLVALAQQKYRVDDGGNRNLIVQGFVSLGADSLHALADAIEASPAVDDFFVLAWALERLGEDPAPLTLRLLQSLSPRVRSRAVWLLTPLLSTPERAAALLQAAADPDPSVRAATGEHPSFMKWSGDDRTAWPGAYEAYITGLRSLLDSDTDYMLRSVIRALWANGALTAEDERQLRIIFRDPKRSSYLRSEALRAYLLRRGADAAALDEVRPLLVTDPDVACNALAAIEPAEIPDDMIDAIVAAMPRTRDHDHQYALNLIVPTWHDKERTRLGVRALPSLLRALTGRDFRLSASAAAALSGLGPDAREATQALLEQLATRAGTSAGSSYVAAMLAIAPDDPAVRAAMERVVHRGEHNPDYAGVAGQALRELLKLRPDEEWVRALVRPILASRSHPLHQYARWQGPIDAAALPVVAVKRLLSELLDTTHRDAMWAYAAEGAPAPADLDLSYKELQQRRDAASALAYVQFSRREDLQALMAALRSDIFESPSPDGGSDGLRAQTKWNVWRHEVDIVRNVADTVASLIASHPEFIAEVIEALKDRPRALAFVLSGRPWDDAKGRRDVLKLPADLPPPLLERAIDTLLDMAERRSPHVDRRMSVIDALSRLPTTDPRVKAMLVRIIFHGGEGAADSGGSSTPASAMTAIGRLRPMTPNLLELIRGHFDDPRPFMRAAALRAAGEVGELALPLLDDALEAGYANLLRGEGHACVWAAERIAPQDPRVVAFLAAHKEAHRKQERAVSTRPE